MKKLRPNRIQVMAVGSLVALALVSLPARANHDHDLVAPAVAFIALGSFLYYNHHHSHHYQHNRHHYGHRPRHSSSYGGYHNPKRNYKGHGGSHNQKRRHDSRY